MYLSFLLLPLLLLLLLLNYRNRKRKIQKVCDMCMCDKCRLLNELLEPFGFSYIPAQDIFTSRTDAWQRKMGYSGLYDEASSHLGMIFDSLPVYFNYRGRTWLLEFWKGQYGINTGCEIGVYYADGILKKEERGSTLFQAVDDADMLKLSFLLYRKGESAANLTERHWWLTAFRVGCFSNPSDLILRISVVFPSQEMARAFVRGLHSAGYSPDDICFCCNTVTFSFDRAVQNNVPLRLLRLRIAQCQNRFWCKIYLFITRPFTLSADRILYLYYYLPFAFRRILRIRRYRK